MMRSHAKKTAVAVAAVFLLSSVNIDGFNFTEAYAGQAAETSVQSECGVSTESYGQLATGTDVVAHVHRWTYDVGADSIIVRCAEDNNACQYHSSGVTFKFSGGSAVYSGSAYQFSIGDDIKALTGEFPGSVTYEGRSGTKYQLTGSAPVNAGKYTAKLTIGGKTVSADFEIKKKDITLTAVSKTKHIGSADPKFGYTAKGLVNGEKLSGIYASREVGQDVGSYKITLSQKSGSNPNYNITFKSGVLSIKWHTYSDKFTVDMKPTCTKQGGKARHCTVCGAATDIKILNATGHKYDVPEFKWSDDGTAVAKFVCENDSSHVETVECEVTKNIVRDATESEDGEAEYIASVSFDGKTYTAKRTVAIPAGQVTVPDAKPAAPDGETKLSKGSIAAPQTGDGYSLIVWMLAFVMSSVGSALMIGRRNKL